MKFPLALREVHVGDCRALLRRLPDESVHCVVTSPPYWGLRDYGVKGQIGLEASPREYVRVMVGVFREVRRVLRRDGTLWLNLGDSYCAAARNGAGDRSSLQGRGQLPAPMDKLPSRGYRGDRLANGRADQAAILRKKTRATRDGAHAGKHTAMGAMEQPNRMPIRGLKPKDLVGIPWRVAFALQAAGWWLRQDNVWHKPNPMPEAVKDRTTRAHEYVFQLSRSAHYYYDGDAIKEPVTGGSHSRGRGIGRKDAAPGTGIKANTDFHAATIGMVENRNKRTVWTIASSPYAGAHFATFPPELAEVCILAGCPPGGIVLDPFGGSGTVGEVAEHHGRRWILFELSPAYADLARQRCSQQSLLVGPATRALEGG